MRTDVYFILVPPQGLKPFISVCHSATSLTITTNSKFNISSYLMSNLYSIIPFTIVYNYKTEIDSNMRVRSVLRNPKTLYVLMTRNYADMMW